MELDRGKSPGGIRSPLSGLSYAQLAEHLRYYWRVNRTGLNYMRKKLGPEKTRCLGSLLSLTSASAWPKGLSIVTFPGSRWIFERCLIAQREHGARRSDDRFPRRTHIACIERDEFVYRAALKDIPGGNHWIKHMTPVACATASIQTPKIQRFSRCHFEDFAYEDLPPIGAAWLDFNGGLTDKRSGAILRFRDQRSPALLALTLSKRGQDPKTIQDLLSPDHLVYERIYADGVVPMHFMVMVWGESRRRGTSEIDS